MRLTEFSGAQELPSYIFHSHILKDMRTLYGYDTQYVYDSREPYNQESPVAVVADDGRAMYLHVNIKDLGNWKNAAKWTALQAYRQRGGAAFKFLSTEMPGVRGAEEWTNRWRQERERAMEARRQRVRGLTRDLSVSEEEYTQQFTALLGESVQSQMNFFAGTSSGSDDGRTDQYFESILEDSAQSSGTRVDIGRAIVRKSRVGFEIDMGMGGLWLSAIELNGPLRWDSMGPWDPPGTHTEFYALGSALPEAARVMASNYGELCFHADEPDETVSRALGAASLSQLDLLWETAMQKPSPLAAGQFVLQALSNP